MIATAGQISDMLMLVNSARRPKIRTMGQFACEEIVIPTGPHEGEYFSYDIQPFTRHWFAAVDSGLFSEHVATGPSQSGKSLTAFVIPVCYFLFELQETTIAGVPLKDMILDKWERDLEPVIARTRYRDLMPTKGAGAKGGTSMAFRFKHGVTLRFMTAGGSDKATASFTAKNICITETDGFDTAKTTSDEGTKLDQIEARARAFERRKRRIFKECTTSTNRKHTWHKYANDSTSSKLLLPCPYCKVFVLPEREHFVGWQDCETSREAEQQGVFCCPECGSTWTEEQRRASNRRSVLVHKGQSVSKNGRISGPIPDTSTLGFRWSAVHNCLLTSADFAYDEWSAQRSNNPELAERKQKQFVWAIPVTEDLETIGITSEEIRGRTVANMPKGYVPLDTQWITIGVDVNKRVLHWTAIAWRKGKIAHVFDYGAIDVAADAKGFKKAIRDAMKDLKESVTSGWTIPKYNYAFVDCRWETDEVMGAIRDLQDNRWIPSLGLGDGHFSCRLRYRHPNKKTGEIKQIGSQYYIKLHKRMKTVYLDANSWKTELQTMLRLNFEAEKGFITEGSMTLFDSSDKNEHVSFANHLTAEEAQISYEPGSGYKFLWKSKTKSNHWLDSTCYASVAGHLAGFRISESTDQETVDGISRPLFKTLTLPDGRSFSVYDRAA